MRLVTAKNAGHMTGQSEVELELTGVTVAGANYDAVSTTYNQAGASRGKRTAETVGGGAVLGGLIGAIAGHGKGAAIGSVIGAGAGTAVQAGTKAPPMKIAPETKIDFTLKAPITVTLPLANRAAGIISRRGTHHRKKLTAGAKTRRFEFASITISTRQ